MIYFLNEHTITLNTPRTLRCIDKIRQFPGFNGHPARLGKLILPEVVPLLMYLEMDTVTSVPARAADSVVNLAKL
jgi:hypothetical protein